MNLEKRREKIRPILVLIEQILEDKKLDKEHYKDEFQKIFSCIIQEVDVVNTFERRRAGVTDEQWDESLTSLYEALEKKIDED